MDPNLFHIDYERTFEALIGIIVLSFIVERIFAFVFESRLVLDREDVTIICGPICEAKQRVQGIERQPETQRQMLYNVVGENNVAVPTSFFKIIVDMRNPQNPDVLAYLVPHIETLPEPERQPENYLTSVDNIENLTGLDFLTNLPTNVQDNIEKVTATSSL